MSVGSNLQEMENVVTKGAAPAEPMQSAGIPVEDLGGPTPENYRPDDDSARLREPGATLAQVRDVVNAKAMAAEEVEVEEDQEEIEEMAKPTKVGVGKNPEAEEIKKREQQSQRPVQKGTGRPGPGGIPMEESDYDGEVVAESEEEVEEVIEEETFDIEEDVNALLEGEELSEEFQEKARTIFEAAIKSKVSEIRENLQTAYEQALVEEIVTIKEGLEDRLDAYLEYVADEWIQENALQVEQGLKTEMTESFLQGMRGLFEEHYVTIPEERYDVIESMVDKLDEMESKLNEQIERNVALNRRLAESVADVIFADVAEGLALSQKDKLASLAENVEFESETDYREKLVTLRESYFSGTSAQKSTSENLSEEVTADEKQALNESVSPMMAAYLETLSRSARK